jgi:hypothetical protein
MQSPVLQVRSTISALILFADIVDSSKYSAVLGYMEYARRLLKFQKLFQTLGRKYFPLPEDRTREYCQVDARGDEGVMFFAQTTGDFAEPVFRAIEFLFHLKGLLRFGGEDDDDSTAAPRRIGLGAGIHVGRVAFATAQEDNRSVIARLEGFSINYAKRVESCSRAGKYSRVFLSSEAARLLEDKPVLFSSITVPMKGIEEHTDVHEVQSGLFSGLKLEPDDPEDNRLVDQIGRLAVRPSEIEEPWVKSLIVSGLDCLLRGSLVGQTRAQHRDTQLKLAWQSAIEDDPILLYLRAREQEEKGNYTRQLQYLQRIVEEHPHFVHARKRMIRACWAIARGKAERSELVFARDMAQEFLERFPHFLSEQEKKECRALLRAATKSRVDGKRRTKQ